MFRWITVALHFSELGSGWKPAVLETKSEHDFIRASQKGLSDAGDYFIAGSALPVQTGSFQYHVSDSDVNNPVYDPQYSTSQSGNVAKISLINFKMFTKFIIIRLDFLSC